MLGPRDRLPAIPQRILVAGLSGSGKTSLARRLAAILAIEHTEIDALHHGAGWQPRPEFLDDVDALVARASWIAEWQYGSARERLADGADALVWLDMPYAVSMTRLVVRTLRRRLRKEVLWNGNVEPPLATFVTDRDHVVRYAWRGRAKYRTIVPELERTHPHLTVVRLRSQADVERWLAGLPRHDDPPRARTRDA